MNRYKKNMEVLKNFFSLSKAQGVELLRDDQLHVSNLTKGLQTATLRNIVFEYLKVWKTHMDMEGTEHRKQNKGRFAANTWIREYLDKK